MVRIKHSVLAVLAAWAIVASTGGAAFAESTPLPSPATSTAPSPSPTATDAPTPSPTTPTIAPTPTETSSPTPTPTPTPTLTPTPTATPTPTLNPTPTPSATVPAAVTDVASVSIQLPSGYSVADLNASKNAIPTRPDSEPHAVLNIVDPTNSANNKVNATLEAIKGRGNFTWTLAKKPYQIKFDSSTSVLGMAKAKTWILLANHADPSLMRNKIAYDLAGAFGLPGSPDSRFIDLTVNGEYLGNYLITEKVEVKTNRLELSDPGGILIELDNLYGSAEPFHFRTVASKSTFVLKDAVGGVDAPLAPAVASAYDAIQTAIAQFEAEIYAPDPDWSKISTMIDVESFIKYYFVQETAANSDVTRSSVYFWRDGPNDVLHAGPAWDYDIAFGNFDDERYGGNPVQDYVKNARVLSGLGGNDWFAQLFRNQEFVSIANEVFEAQLKPTMEAVLGGLDAHTENIARSAAANFTRWPGVLGSPAQFYLGHPVADTWSAEVSRLRAWLATRISHISSAYASGMPVLTYSSHVSAIGWQNSLSGGQIAGTEGRGLQVEALDVALVQNGFTGSIQSRAHVQATGWTAWQTGDTRVGTTGLGLQLEAVQFRLTDDLAARYNISYRVHVQAVGWMDWVSNGKVAGTSGRGLQIEAVQIRLLQKPIGDQAPAEKSSVTYEAHVQARGWMPQVSDGAVAGTTGAGLSMQALRASVSSNTYTGDLEYRAHVQGIGWMEWSDSAEYVGTVGRGLRMEAIEIRLTGEIAEHYSLRYSAHVQGIGWMDWTGEGQTAGTTGRGLQMEALKIELVPKTP